MKSVSHKKMCNGVTVQVHVYTPLIPMIKSNNYDKSDKYFVKIKFHWDPTPEKLDLYGFKMSLFDNSKPK